MSARGEAAEGAAGLLPVAWRGRRICWIVASRHMWLRARWRGPTLKGVADQNLFYGILENLNRNRYHPQYRGRVAFESCFRPRGRYGGGLAKEGPADRYRWLVHSCSEQPDEARVRIGGYRRQAIRWGHCMSYVSRKPAASSSTP